MGFKSSMLKGMARNRQVARGLEKSVTRMTLGNAGKGALYGAGIGGGIAALQGNDIWEGAKGGAVKGALGYAGYKYGKNAKWFGATGKSTEKAVATAAAKGGKIGKTVRTAETNTQRAERIMGASDSNKYYAAPGKRGSSKRAAIAKRSRQADLETAFGGQAGYKATLLGNRLSTGQVVRNAGGGFTSAYKR